MALTASITDFSGGVTGVNAPNFMDIWDGQAKTLVFDIGIGEGNPYWQAAYEMTPEWWASLQNQLYSSKNGILWQHNQENYCQFYGEQKKPFLVMVANAAPSDVKVFNSLSVKANKVPLYTYMTCQIPYQQITDLYDYQWRDMEGVFYATIMRNKITPTFSGFNTSALLTGEIMRSHAMKIFFQFSGGGGLPLQLRFININFDISKGHLNFNR